MKALAASHFLFPRKKTYIRYHYVLGQWISIFCTFAGTLFSLRDYLNPNTRKPENVEDYIWSFGIAIAAATIAAYTANKFQGSKIVGVGHNPRPKFTYDIAPRNWKSNTAESAYLIFATLLLLVNNYFLLAAIKANLLAFVNPNRIYPLLPLSIVGLIILIIKTVGIDLIFNTTNAHYEAAEEIKEDITDSKAGPLVSRICKPLTSNHLIFTATLVWIKTIGVLSHTFTDYLGLWLSIPPILLIKLYKIPSAFWPTLLTAAALSVPLLFVNCAQTLYFEAKESEINLNRLHKEGSFFEHYPYLAPPEDKSSFLRSLLTWKPKLKEPIRYGFFTQAPLHAFGDILPVILFIQDIFDRHESSNVGLEVTIIVALAAYVFITSTYGTHESEVKTSIRHFDKDFKDVGEPTEYRTHSV